MMERTVKAPRGGEVTEVQTALDSRSRAAQERAALAFEPGARIAGRYRVMRLLGQGGFGEVYEVLDGNRNEQPVALKIARLESSESRVLDALKSEFSLLSTLVHPNLAEVFDFGHLSDSTAFFTQRLVSGAPLGVVRVRPDDPTHVPLWSQLCHALDYLHARGILHGDIKPSNILVDERERRLTLLDFGISRAFGGHGERQMVGTFSYMAPEAITGAPVDARADLYSLGITLYRLIVGHPPFRGSSAEVLTAQLSQVAEPLPPHLVRPTVARVIEQLLCKEPGARYATASEVLRALAEATGYELPRETAESLSGYVLSSNLVGQASAQERLRRHVQGPVGAALLLTGESGSGKSRLLREARQYAQLAGCSWIGVAATSTWAQRSLVPTIARAVLTQETVEALDSDARVELSRALPELRLPRQRLGVPVDPERARRQRVRALAHAIGLRFRGRAGVIAVEDLHRLDESVLSLLALLVDECREQGAECRWVFTSWPDAALGWSERLGGACIELPLLDWAAARELLASMFGNGDLIAGTALGEALQHGRHSALFVQESLRLFLETGAIVRRGGAFQVQMPLPALELAQVLSQRVERRSAVERRVGLALAVLTGERTVAELQRVSGGKPAATAAALRAMVRAGLVEERFDPRVRAVYAMHDRLRDVWITRARRGRLTEIHRKAARMLMATARSDYRQLFEAAEHFVSAAQPDHAVRVLERTATAALGVGRPDQAAAALLRAEGLGSVSPARLLRLFDLCRIAGMRHEMQGALGALEEHAVDDDVLRPQVLLRRARAHIDFGDAEQARLSLDEATAAFAGRATAHDHARMAIEKARFDDEFGELGHALQHYLAAARQAQAAKARDVEARAWLGASLAHLRLGAPEDCAQCAARAQSAARAVGDPVLASDALRNMGNAAREVGKARRARGLYRRAVQVARDAGSPEAEAKALNNLGTVCQWLGLIPEAVSSLERALRLKLQLGLTASVLLTRNNLGGFFLAIGRLEDGERELSEVMRARGTAQPVIVSLAKSNLGDLCLLRGDVDAALDWYRQGHAGNLERGVAVQDSHALSGIIRSLLLRGQPGDLEEARSLLATLAALPGVDSLAEARRRHAVTEALVRDAAGDTRGALSAIRRARQLSTDALQLADVFSTHLEALWLEAIIQSRSGHRAAARRSVERARGLLDKLALRFSAGHERERFEQFHPLHRAVRAGQLDVPRGRVWGDGI
ncbi:MAG: protein kinase [Polyangiaceae bacterium]